MKQQSVSRIKKILHLPALLLKMTGYIKTQKSFLQKNIADILQKAMNNNDGSLDNSDILKITNYYGLAVPAILGEAFCKLRGNPMTKKEREASTCQGAMTGLFDDFFDKDYLEEDAIENILKREDTSTISKSNRMLFDYFYHNALVHVEDPSLMLTTLHAVYLAQVESKKQVENHISEEQLLDITFRKGGSSLLFYRSAFSPPASETENKILFDLGALMQLSNDLFDVYKDREAGIKTLITETESIAVIRKLYTNYLRQYFCNAYLSGYPENNIRTFLDILSMGIFSRCYVCMDQLEALEKFTGNKFSVLKYSRSQLICDMDKKRNMLRSAYYHTTQIL